MRTTFFLLPALVVLSVVGCGPETSSSKETVDDSKPSTSDATVDDSKPSSAMRWPGVVAKTNPKDDAEVAFVPAGEFNMGDDQGEEDERPKRKVTLDGYWIYKYEVTVAQYRRFCEATGRRMPAGPPWGFKDNHPMVNVTWQDAADYAQWAGASLPTEAEWEKAARGTDGRRYPWGDEWDPDKCANSVMTQLGSTQPVGSYPAGESPCGAMDLAGNVWEWCADWYQSDYYETAPTRNPTGPSAGDWRVLRGGSWDNIDPDCFRATNRLSYCPTYSNSDLGFRCILRSPGP